MFGLKFRASGSGEEVTVTPDESVFNKVINYCLFALTLLVPIFFLYVTFEVREFNKQALIFVGVAVMLACFLIKTLSTRKIAWVKSPFDYLLLFYVLLYLVTSLVSIDKISSFEGYYGRFTGSFISVLSLVILYFLVVNVVRSQKVINKSINLLSTSFGIVIVFSLLQFLGMFILPIDATHNRAFNLVGSLSGLAVFASLAMIFFQAQLISGHGHKVKKTLLMILSVVALIDLVLINAFVAWLVLSLGLIALLSFAQSTAWKPILMLMVAILFVAFQFVPQIPNPRNLISVELSIELQLSNRTTWNLVANSLKSGPKQALLGTGPGTVGIAFGGIKPQELNNTIVWSLNFDRASSEIANIAIETGLIGLLTFELIAILFLIFGGYTLIKRSDHPDWTQLLGFFVLWLSLYVAHFFIFFNITFYFLYWLSIALFMALLHRRNEVVSRGSALPTVFLSLMLLAGVLIGSFFMITIYGADVNYTQAIKKLGGSNPDLEEASNKLSRAIDLNPYRDTYHLTYGQILFLRASKESQKKDPEKPDANLVLNLASASINAGRSATAVSPAKAGNWQALAQFYANIKPLVPNADDFIIKSLEQAVEKDHKNPVLRLQLGIAYVNAERTLAAKATQAQPKNKEISEKLLKQAEESFNQAIILKRNLADSYIQIARVLQAQNRLADAKQKLLDGTEVLPSNTNIKFELGLIYYNEQNYDEAEKMFAQVLALVPNHVNTLYSVGLLYIQKGNFDIALRACERVKEIIGSDERVEKCIDEAKKGQESTPKN